MNSKIKLIVIGGNRLNEEYPFKSLIELKKKYKFELHILTENTHLKKPINYDKQNFDFFLNKNKLQFTIIKNYKHLYKVIKNITIDANTFILLLNSVFLIKKDIISLIKSRIFNLHIGKLPEQRGAGTTTWQFMSNIFNSAVTIHRVGIALDQGRIIVEKKFKIKRSSKPIDYYKLASKYEKKALEIFLKNIIKKKFKEIDQKEKNSVYMPRIDTNTHSYINWSWSEKEILSFIKSFDKPFLGARTFLDNKKCVLSDANLVRSSIKFHPFQSGIIIRHDKKFIFIALKNAILRVRIKFISKKKVNHLLGRRLYTPIKYLETAMVSKAIHKPNSIKIKKIKFL
ncbi:formyltransferase family protein [Candidatus Pelagibacter sp. HIMB1517]|uniref:formyltransferase family protein n=1 Tax=Candidatus Pelagibacter sp. HIMB1517 TaxID=3413341 RepID=UPI003F86F798